MSSLDHGVVDLGEITTATDIAPSRHALADLLTAGERDNLDDITTVLSELETNALLHAGGATGVRARLLEDLLRIEVDDPSPEPPAPRARGGPDGGFGLRIVDQLAVRWGYALARRGKTVWAIVRCPRVNGPAAVRPG